MESDSCNSEGSCSTIDDHSPPASISDKGGKPEALCAVQQALIAPSLNPQLKISTALQSLRQLVLEQGLPPTADEEKRALRAYARTTTRGNMWKILLGARQVSCEEYLELVSKGPSEYHNKIADDAFRTFASDRDFTAAVTRHQGEVVYVQGMNAICGALLTTMNEPDAFASLAALAQRHCPLYFTKCLDGVHRACALVDQALLHVDPPRAHHLRAARLDAKISRLPWILSLGSSLPPLSEAARLLDFLFAAGVHATVLCAVGRLRLLRDQLLAAARPMALLQRLPPTDAPAVAAEARRAWRTLPPHLQAAVRAHPVRPVPMPPLPPAEADAVPPAPTPPAPV